MTSKPLRSLVPYLTVKDVQKSVLFYRDAFGLEVCNESRNDRGVIIHIEMKSDDVRLMFAPEGACSEDLSKSPKSLGIECSMGIYAYCADVDQMFERAIQNGARARSAPKDRFWGERTCEVEDLDGYQWYFTQAIQ